MKGADKEWRLRGGVARIELTLSYVMLMRVSQLFAEDDGEDVAFYTGERQVDTMEVKLDILRAIKGDGSKVLARINCDGSKVRVVLCGGFTIGVVPNS